MRFVDTNVVLRYLTRDDKVKAERCKKLLQDAVSGKSPSLFISDMAVAEIVWVLESVYKLSSSEVNEKLEVILAAPNLEFQNKAIVSQCLVIYATYNVDFIDAYQAVLAQHLGISRIYSYDTDFNKLAGVERVEP